MRPSPRPFIDYVRQEFKRSEVQLDRYYDKELYDKVEYGLLTTERGGLQNGLSKFILGGELKHPGIAIRAGIEAQLESHDDYDLSMYPIDGVIIVGGNDHRNRAKYGHMVIDLIGAKVSDVRMHIEDLPHLKNMVGCTADLGIREFLLHTMTYDYARLDSVGPLDTH
jgi:hypothetical protein